MAPLAEADPVAQALRLLARGTGPLTDTVLEWLRQHELLPPEHQDRAGWSRLLRTHGQLAVGARRARLPAWASPSPGRRASPSVALRLGRRLFAAKHRA